MKYLPAVPENAEKAEVKGTTLNKFGTAVILAGGKSMRMQFDKQFLNINGKRLLDKLALKLKSIFDEVMVVTNTPGGYINIYGCHNNGYGDISDEIEGNRCRISDKYRIICDEIKDKGPLGGIHIGLKSATSEYVYFLACDMPDVNSGYIGFMQDKINGLKAGEHVDACITKFGEWIEPFNAFYSKNLVKSIENYLLDEKGMSIFSFIKKMKCIYIEEKDARRFSPGWNMFLNLNTRDELLEYLDSMKCD